MTDLKTWTPFRFLRHEKANHQPPARSGNGVPRNFVDFRAEVERMIDRVWSDPFASLETPDRWFGDFRQGDFTPKLDVTDDKDALRVTVEIPGVETKDLAIEYASLRDSVCLGYDYRREAPHCQGLPAKLATT